MQKMIKCPYCTKGKMVVEKFERYAIGHCAACGTEIQGGDVVDVLDTLKLEEIELDDDEVEEDEDDEAGLNG